MSTVMGTVDKKPICLTVVLASQAQIRNLDYGKKLKNIVELVGAKIAELFLSVREDFEFRGFETDFHQCSMTSFRRKLLEIRRQRQDIILGFFIGDFPYFTSCNNALQNYFLIPSKTVQSLPDDLKHEEVWDKVTRTNIGQLISHLIHEIMHSLGAFHSEFGIMAGYPDLLADARKSIKDFKLLSVTDMKTLTIVCESLSIITTLNPQRNLKYVPESGRLIYETDQSIAAVFFVYQEKYTAFYKEFTYLDACKRCSELAPSLWDTFVVVHFCGHIFHYTKKDVLTTKRCTKAIIY